MTTTLKPLAEQVIVITGATSGIGLATARLAVERGARVVANGRTAGALEQLEHQLDPRGERAACVAGDVANRADVQRLAEVARERFGGFDTWINNAGASAYGRLEEMTDEDARRIFETNFWGTVYGSLAAVRFLRQRGGALVNVGSTVSDRAIPLQGMYGASKHAVKAFTDALRMELEHDGTPISVTLV
jgi:NAD(P)-dependent dehydrogenase (short-subunit alcohol dehydrogenase family)